MPDRSNLKIRAGRSGVHLFSRKTGLNIFLNEVRVPDALWARAPREISIALTNVCDLSCPYCYAPKNSAALDVEKIAGWLDELDANGCLGVGFGGGEPTLYRHFTEICRYAAKNTGLAVTFTTHGHRLNDSLAAGLVGVVHFIRVSMDGVGTTYEALRGCSFAAFKSQIATIRALAPFGINFVVNRYTLPDLNAAIDVAAEVGATEFLLLPEQQVRGAGGIDEATMGALQEWVLAYRGLIPLAINITAAANMPTSSVTPDETGLSSYAHIDSAGILKPSSYAQHGAIIGPGGVMEALDLLQTQGEEQKS
jgi:MoaA/NifB/PqqE/SkfB family radical SAM enzyme